MDQKTMTIKCFRCQKQFPLMDMVMDASGKGMVCRPCAGLKPKAGSTAAASPSKTLSAREQFAKPKNPAASKGKYACENCKFHFPSSKPVDQLICPYCGSRRISTPSEHSADALLRDASTKEYDF